MTIADGRASRAPTYDPAGLVSALNGRLHFPALIAFGAIVLLHWVEHLAQAVQIWGLGWPRPDAGGAIGLLFPSLVTEEWLHFAYAVVMLVGLVVLLPGFLGEGRRWWRVALWIQVWHFFEHFLLLVQAQAGVNLLGRPVPTSVIQVVLPRVELHLFYNIAVMIPMAVALVHHLYPRRSDRPAPACSCSRLESLGAT